MAIQYSLTHRTNAMSQLNTDIGASAVIKIWSGAAPATCATADSGTLLATFAGNAGGFGTAAAQVLTASAVASTTGAAAGIAGYFRIYPSAATNVNAVVQGTVTATGGGGDMILTNTNIASGQAVNFTSLTVTAFGV
jgi:hypothetical protein